MVREMQNRMHETYTGLIATDDFNEALTPGVLSACVVYVTRRVGILSACSGHCATNAKEHPFSSCQTWHVKLIDHF